VSLICGRDMPLLLAWHPSISHFAPGTCTWHMHLLQPGLEVRKVRNEGTAGLKALEATPVPV